jgi:threonine synthase
MTLAVSKALEGGAEAVACASTGNTAASAPPTPPGRA